MIRKNCQHCDTSFDGDKKRRYCSESCGVEAKRLRDRERARKPYDPTSDQTARSICPVGAFWCSHCRQFHPVENAVMRYGRPLKCKGCKHDEHVRLAIKKGRQPPVRYKCGDPLRLGNRNPWAKYDGAYTPIVERNARDAWKHWLYCKAPAWWLDAYYQSSDKPWLDHRFSDQERYASKYKHSEAYRHAEIARSRLNKGKRRKRKILTDDGTVDYDQLLGERSSCPYCRSTLSDDNRTIDHITPIKRGGTHSASNLVACCRPCNSRKSAKLFVDWIDELSTADAVRACRMYEAKKGAPPKQVELCL